MVTKLSSSDSVVDDSRLVAVLDVGTSKVVVVVGMLPLDSYVSVANMEVIAVGESKSRGLQRGIVTNIDLARKSIDNAIDQVTAVIRHKIKAVYVGISGRHVTSETSMGMLALQGREVTHKDIKNVIESAQAIRIPADRQIMHILPQSYILDKHQGIDDPLGMSGMRLEVDVHLISCEKNIMQNLKKCINLCNLEVIDMIVSPLAASHLAVTDDEREIGVCMIDIGEGTTDVISFVDGNIHRIDVIPIAGSQITNDIAIALRTPLRHAESIKIESACATLEGIDTNDQIQVATIGERPQSLFPKHILAQVVQARYAELFRMIDKDLRHNKVQDFIMGGGIVLTGGSANMRQVVALAEDIFRMPVRLGHPSGIIGKGKLLNSPAYSVVAGLLFHVGMYLRHEKKVSKLPKFSFDNVIRWIKDNF